MTKRDRLTLIAHLPHISIDGKFYSYEPYVREMNLWSELFESIDLYTEVVYDKPSFAVSPMPSNITIYDLGITGGGDKKSRLRRFFQTTILPIRLYRIIRKAKYLHFRSPGYTTFFANVVNYFLKRKVVIKWATSFPPQRAMGKISKWEANLILKSSDNTQVMCYNDISKRNFHFFFPALFSNKELNEISSLQDNTNWEDVSQYRFICVGRLHPDKNIELIVRGLRRYIDQTGDNDFQIELIGDGPSRSNIEDLAQHLGISKNLILRGSLPFKEVLHELKNANFLIMPGVNEGWGKVINEALAANCIPIVVSEGNGASVLKQMGSPGLFFEAHENGFSQIIQEAIALSKDKINRFIKVGAEANSSMTLEKFKEKLSLVLETLDK
tara:strand:- start:18311 stop:19462 length:1152 start_codon:yes stop_codon:yes gene_type:complete